MPVGEVIFNIILRPIVELVLYGITYFTGFLILKAISVGGFRLAPLSTLREKNPGRKKWYQIDSSIWHHRTGRGRMLSAEFVCIVGVIVWAMVGMGIYLEHRGKDEGEKAALSDAAKPPR